MGYLVEILCVNFPFAKDNEMRSTVSRYQNISFFSPQRGKVFLYAETLEEMGMFNSYCCSFFFSLQLSLLYKLGIQHFWKISPERIPRVEDTSVIMY